MVNQGGCQKRFKGVENFFRRIAYNLGNSASQTEVKIISCIPIDVTDLQQRIADLEKQLKEANCKNQKLPSHTTLVIPLSSPEEQARCCTSNNKSSATTQNMKGPVTMGCTAHRRKSCSFAIVQTPSISNSNTAITISDTRERCNTSRKCRKELNPRKFFMKKKLRKLKPAVYYAHTDITSPFNYRKPLDVKKDDPLMDRSYLKHLVRKQYMPTLTANDSSMTSEFSTPICRDNVGTCRNTCGVESDLCSCCHGPFHNLDTQLTPPSYYCTREFYDSTLYDVVPVKERPIKLKEDNFKKHKKSVDIECWPGTARNKAKSRPIVVDYDSLAALKDKRRSSNSNKNNKDIVLKRMAAMKPLMTCSPNTKICGESSRLCTVDVSEIYARKKKDKNNKQINEQKCKEQNNLSCETAFTDNHDTKTEPAATNTKEVVTSPELMDSKNGSHTTEDDRTTTTLKQIKSILQSVLAEVKTNSSLSSKNNNDKKDAVVQNGPSQNNILEGSRLLHSFTYSPYNMDPFMAACSRQITNPIYYNNIPQAPAAALPNYPMYMHPASPILTNCCNTKCSLSPQTVTKPGTSASTNTDPFNSPTRSRETQRLIKEIYDSIGLNEKVPSKDSSGKKSENTTRLFNAIPQVDTTNDVMYTMNGVSELFKTSKTLETSFTPKTDSKELSKETLTRSDESSNPKIVQCRHIASASTDYETLVETNAEGRAESVDSEEEESSSVSTSSETEYVETVRHPRDIKKQSLLSRVMKFFQPKTTNKPKSETNSTTEDESEEELENETVYSEATRPRALKPTLKLEQRSKMSIKAAKQGATNKSEQKKMHLEQENRRCWEENVVLQNKMGKHSLDKYRVMHSANLPFYREIDVRRAEVERANSSPLEKRKLEMQRASDEHKQVKKVTSPSYLAWLKKQKLLKCGEQWKRFVLEN